MKFGDALKRKNRALDESLAWLKENGQDTPSARNDLAASSEAAFEAGAFDDPADTPFDEKRRDGFIVRGRSDAMAAKLNSGAAADAIVRIEKKLDRIEWLAGVAAALTMIIAIRQFF